MVWRQVEVAGGITLAWLSVLFHLAMGWTDLHHAQFTVGKRAMNLPGPEARRQLKNLGLEAGNSFHWVHDMGQGWRHLIQVEAIHAPLPGVKYPRLIAGSGPCPGPGDEDPYEYLASGSPSEDDPHSDPEIAWAESPRGGGPIPFQLAATAQRVERLLKARCYA
jgi:hypothetical protein